MKINVGIDLGTTYSAVATFVKENGGVRIFKNGDGKECTPSVVCLSGGRVIIGEEAKEEQRNGNVDTAAFYKSMMGNENYAAYIGGGEYSAETLSGMFLTELIKDIEASNGVQIGGAVITVPAYFNEKQRNATIRAGEAAGLKVLKIINEPTAAIIAYGLTAGKEKNVLVYDLGGGTFDITIAHVNGTQIDVLATNGNHELGGKNWDAILIDYVQERFYSDYDVSIEDHPEDYKELQVKCEEAKKRLSQVSATTIMMQCEGLTGKYEVTKEYFDDMSRVLLEETLQLIQASFNEIGEAQGRSFGWADIDEVVLVGGSTRMPQVRDMIIAEYGKPPITKDINVDTIVATGAAMQAELCVSQTIQIRAGSLTQGAAGAFTGAATPKAPAMTLTISNSEIRDITSHSLGMLALSSDEKSYINSIIIKKNSYINKVFSKQYTFAGKALEVYVMQGESRDPYDCDILGKYVITGMPQGTKSQLSVNFLYNSNGVVEVNANLADGSRLTATKETVTESIDEIIARLKREKEEAEEAARRATCVEIVLAIDSSGSMGGNRIGKAKSSAQDFIDEFDLKHTYITVLSFGDQIKKVCTDSSSKGQITSAIRSITVGEVGYGTDARPIDAARGLYRREGHKILVVLTDGVWGNQVSETSAADSAKADGIIIYGIGIGEADQAFLDRISSNRGKKVDLSQLTTVFKEVATSIATEVSTTTLR
ncbi:MAG: Hsp70 family protein [Clostridia bacterium]|nr:Hsp70 family protein [Clostridia bacterium]